MIEFLPRDALHGECALILYGKSSVWVYGRFPDGYFPGWFFSRKDVSRVVIFLDETFPRETS